MNILDCVIEFIRKTEPNYVYRGPMDFTIVVDSEENFSFQDWNLKMDMPDINECLKLKDEKFNKKESVKCVLNVVKNYDDIISPVEGSLIIHKGELHVFMNGVWKPI